MKVEEIARQLHISTGQAKRICNRALRKIQENLTTNERNDIVLLLRGLE
jgi:DNA-directed RNA polymerase specialized sigma24 family protein